LGTSENTNMAGTGVPANSRKPTSTSRFLTALSRKAAKEWIAELQLWLEGKYEGCEDEAKYPRTIRNFANITVNSLTLTITAPNGTRPNAPLIRFTKL
jgi:hypothetical protein